MTHILRFFMSVEVRLFFSFVWGPDDQSGLGLLFHFGIAGVILCSSDEDTRPGFLDMKLLCGCCPVSNADLSASDRISSWSRGVASSFRLNSASAATGMCAILGTGGSGFFLQVNIRRIDLLDAETKDGTWLLVE
jgi:hypothetical protein